MLTVLALGWHYSLLGFVVPVAMLGGMLGGTLRGRFVCGNLCPRGSFFDTFFAKIGPTRPIPEKLFGIKLRSVVMLGLMGFMSYRLAQDPGNWQHWGLVFWQMCLITTAAAIIMGALFRPRSWCAVCPVGTIGNLAGGSKYQLTISANCRSCGICEKSCPMGHRIVPHQTAGYLRERDCLQCSRCANVCPAAALTLEKVSQYRPPQPDETETVEPLRKAA